MLQDAVNMLPMKGDTVEAEEVFQVRDSSGWPGQGLNVEGW